MDDLPDIIAGEILLLIGPNAEKEAMLDLAAALALRGPTRILDGGNQFDAYHVARSIRRHTIRLFETLNHITIARAFTCYQVVALFEATQAVPFPQLVFNLLTTFYDEDVSTEESYRLLKLVAGHLHRLRQHAPIVISIHPPAQPERAGLVKLLMDISDHVFIRETAVSPTPTRLL